MLNNGKYWFRVKTFFLWMALDFLGGSPLYSADNESTRGPSVLSQEIGVRALGLGGAVTGLAAGAGTLYWNPAGLQGAPRQEVQFGYNDLLLDQTQNSLAYVRPFWRRGERETIALSVSHLSYGDVELVEEGQPDGTIHPRELAVGVSYARPLGSGAWGVTGKWVQQDLADQEGQAYSFDFGYQGTRARWGYGASLTNLGPGYTIGSTKTELPLVVRLGAVHHFPLASEGEILLAGQGESPAGESVRGQFGLEWGQSFARTWRGAVRGGWRTEGGRFTIGAGLERRGFELNYAYDINGEELVFHRFDMTFRFGNPISEEIRRKELVESAGKALEDGRYLTAADQVESLEALSPRAQAVRELRTRLNRSLAETVDPATLWREGEDARKAGKREEAAHFYRKLLIVQPSHAEATRALKEVEEEIDRARLAAAKEDVQRARRRDNQAAATRARAASTRGEWALAYREWSRIDLSAEPKGTYVSEKEWVAERVYEEALRAAESGQTVRAAELYELLAKDNPPYRDSARQLKLLRERESAAGRARAKELYEEGLTVYREGGPDRARSLFEEALKNDPDHRAAQRALERLRTGPPSRP